MERTQTTQRTEPPELSAGALDVLNEIVDRLTHCRPDGTMKPAMRVSMPQRYAEQGRSSTTAAPIVREVLRVMPRLDRPVTRGEYALLLTRAMQEAAR